MFMGLLFTAPAYATCPSPFGSYTCAPSIPGGGGPGNICTFTGSGTTATVECDVSTANAASTITAVSDYGTADDEIEVWGYFESYPFCCEMDMTNHYNVTLYGSGYDDTLEFTYSSETYNLAPISGYSPGDMVGAIYGGGGTDTIRGSDLSTGGDYSFGELLYGEGGTDHIYGNNGDDYLSGGVYRDFLYGEGGADTIDGGGGNDIIDGGLGDDVISGGDGDDVISGNGGADEIDGDDGEDQIGSGAGNDLIDGGDDADVICGGPGVNDDISDGDATEEADPDQIWDDDGTGWLRCQHDSTRWGISTTLLLDGCISASKLGDRPEDCP